MVVFGGPLVKAATGAIAAILLSMSVPSAAERYPSDVATFIKHVADCNELANRKMDAFGLAEFGCFNFETQRANLMMRYHGRLEIVAALKEVSIRPAFR